MPPQISQDQSSVPFCCLFPHSLNQALVFEFCVICKQVFPFPLLSQATPPSSTSTCKKAGMLMCEIISSTDKRIFQGADKSTDKIFPAVFKFYLNSFSMSSFPTPASPVYWLKAILVPIAWVQASRIFYQHPGNRGTALEPSPMERGVTVLLRDGGVHCGLLQK